MKKKRMLAVAALSMTAVLMTACSGGSGSSTGGGSGEASTIKLGGLAPLTGNYAEYGKGFQIGWQMAIDEINAAGGVNGH